MQQKIFFKQVRKDGSSLFAIGKYRRTYKIGRRYTFNERTPAFIYGVNNGSTIIDGSIYHEFPEQSITNHDLIYSARPEIVGGRVLICLGEVSKRTVRICKNNMLWNFRDTCLCDWFCSIDFIVIGEIFPRHRDLDVPRTRNPKILHDIE